MIFKYGNITQETSILRKNSNLETLKWNIKLTQTIN